ncbi:hypothetical protein ACQ4PT_020345 [Festuca glaucescens]
MAAAGIASLLLLLVVLPLSTSDDSLVVGRPLSPGATIVSDGGAFELGFFSPSNSVPASQYLGIWYSGITELTVVWVANRESPAITGRPILTLTNASSLVLSDENNGHVLWATDTVAPDVGAGSAVAVLTDAGNLELRSPNNTVLWQSFDDPTDTFLPGMRVRTASEHGRGGGFDFLVSWKGPGDPSPGQFAYGVDPVTSLQLFTWNGTRPLWRSGAWTGFRVNSEYVANINTIIYLAVVDTTTESYMAFTLSPGAPRTRYVMAHSGIFELQSWTSDRWDTLGRWPPHECSRYGHCGAFGYCDNTAEAPSCHCLAGFDPASPEEWRRGSFAQGCRRKEELRCGAGEDTFLPVPLMKAPDRFMVVENKGAAQCAAECAGNCSCVAYAHTNLSSSSRGDATRCLVWTGDLIDTERIGTVGSAETLYLRLRVAASATAGRTKERNTVKIVLPVLASVLVLVCLSIGTWVCKSKGKKHKHENLKMLVLGDLQTAEGHGAGSPTGSFEFQFVSFKDIVAATNNFNESLKIGHGGFGKVYKAILDGREVAIKRLGKDSDQGMVEFRNEVNLIAKLQHRNLVRLLGCCLEGDEKLLIYEYMPNKSLDAHLFKSTRNTVLDWPTRFRIIKGVAKGLLYLHQDSILKIIHRDLKASNLLLDEEMNPKIADFGMARMFGDNQQKADTKRVVGTYGYMAPEYAMRGIFSAKSDVYSFGVLTLEVVSGIKICSTYHIDRGKNLIVSAWNQWNKGNIKDLVEHNIVESYIIDEALLCIQLGLLCVQDNPNDRPPMSSVVFILENGSATLSIPNKPVYFPHMDTEVEHVTGNAQSSKNSLTFTVLGGR